MMRQETVNMSRILIIREIELVAISRFRSITEERFR
jgi:hypothetical protein